MAVQAQTPDPETLRRLLEQRQGLPEETVEQPSPVDRARERARREREEREAAELTPEERVAELSPIEREYNRRLGRLPLDERQRRQADEAGFADPNLLLQFGYEIFRSQRMGGRRESALTGRLPPDYVLGVGDEIVVTLVGSTNRTVATRVDREGRVVLPELPPVPAAGRPFAEFEAALRQVVTETLLGTELFVSVGSLRVIDVAVLGEVGAPGIYDVTSLTDLLQVLARAGGIEKTGSLRRITVHSAGQRRVVDLYELMQGEAKIDLRLRDGDRVVVPVIGETIAVAGEVVRPGIYELPPGATELAVADALALAGDAIRPRGIVIRRDRIDDAGRQRLAAVNRSSAVRSNDVYEIMPARDIQALRVEIAGHVRQPGTRPLDAAPTLSALLDDGEALAPDPYLPFAVLETTDPETLQRVYQPISLGPTLAGAEDIRLKDQDRLIVLGSGEVDYLSSQAVRGAVLAPEAVTGGACPAVQALAQRAQQADTERLAAAARSVFIAEEAAGESREQARQAEERLAEAEEAAADEVLTEAELARQAAQRAECNPLFEEHPALLPLAIEYSVAALGAVREPGLYPVADESTLRELVAASGGLTLSADPARVEISTFRAGEAAREGDARRFVDLTKLSLAQVGVEPGSSVRFGAQQARMETGTVLVSGEFRYPGVYTINKGETMLSVIERAGGLTDQAYPFGAVFTRVRVKQEQEQSFRRTARELNNALALAVLKENVSGEGLQAATALVANLSSAEAAGRVVVEADPAILRRNPERDIILESGDSIFMPSRPNFVLAAGDLLNPGALSFTPGKGVEDYLAEAGGFQETADDGRVFVVLPNGVARPVTLSLWTTPDIEIPPGSTIVVPKDVDPLETLNIFREITNVLSNLAISAASIAVIGDN